MCNPIEKAKGLTTSEFVDNQYVKERCGLNRWNKSPKSATSTTKL